MSQPVIPDSRCKKVTRTRFIGGVAHEPVFCFECGKLGAWVPQENMDFAAYVCPTCAEKPEVQRVFGSCMMPDEMFWNKVRDAQLEKYGRWLTPQEMAQELANDGTSNEMKKLKREADERHRIASTR